MSKGFLIFAQNTKTVDYLKQAYCLALSIKNSQQQFSNVSLVTNNKVPKKYQKVFDQIIPIPWVDDSTVTRYAGEHRWKLFHVTPYDETIVLDSDMLVLEDISTWWNQCGNYDIAICSRVKNHKLEVVSNDFYRKAFTSNNLTSTYFGLHYFKKTDTAYTFYKALEFVCNNWEWCYTTYAPNYYQDHLSMDLATSIAIELSGIYEAVNIHCPLEFIHMKPMVQDWETPSVQWKDSVSFNLNSSGDLVVGNIKQSKIFHYVEKDFLNNRVVNLFEGLVNGKKT
jgi:hypothetical protein